eukprot:9304735-Pyramimonas_sp.AAC.1
MEHQQAGANSDLSLLRGSPSQRAPLRGRVLLLGRFPPGAQFHVPHSTRLVVTPAAGYIEDGLEGLLGSR